MESSDLSTNGDGIKNDKLIILLILDKLQDTSESNGIK